ncbi:unnamed protein product [Tilletia caries]|uniref:Glycosyl hydrolase family 32 N-terminal domain-containing protein n=1 Tax=Tilletia caries TaxID=13290 RepID=A0A177UI72_9BASI|nr:hypothetical protein A4X03_0g1509 [Tilletia caries]CAD6887744.1 unnamed protein product [Tilletia caries]CAD6943430.1 unnamed protein product [Tilletia caries]CAD7066805.1 unnamed protein product [Tilletia caries]
MLTSIIQNCLPKRLSFHRKANSTTTAASPATVKKSSQETRPPTTTPHPIIVKALSVKDYSSATISNLAKLDCDLPTKEVDDDDQDVNRLLGHHGLRTSTSTFSSSAHSASSSAAMTPSTIMTPYTIEEGETRPNVEAANAALFIDKPPSWPAFAKWRPSYHFIAPYGWMNDPCAPFYDAKSKLFHIFFEWNPHGSDWGNMSWGHATSPDLVNWTRIDHASTATQTQWGPALEPEAPYDHLGIFTGCALARPPVLSHEAEETEESVVTAVYTSVSHLPIHYTLPYTHGAETLSIATSLDGGKSWRRADEDGINPILSGPPKHLEVTAWRDPSVSAWPAMDALLGRSPGQYLYGTIAGGLRVKEGTPTPRDTPTAFLYSIPTSDLRQWKFETTLFDLGFNLPQGSEQGDWGKNFEVCNVFPLPVAPASSAVEAEEWQVGVINVEACLETSLHVPICTPPQTGDDDEDNSPTPPNRLPRRAMWMRASLDLVKDGDISAPKLTPRIGGPLDWGCLYAANTYEDNSGAELRRVMWGWIPDDDLSSKHTSAQGWQGCLALPRLISVQQTETIPPHGMTADAYAAQLRSFGNFDAQVTGNQGTVLVRTLAVEPVPEVLKLREGIVPRLSSFSLSPASVVDLPPVLAKLVAEDGQGRCELALSSLEVTSRCWEAEVSIDLNPSPSSTTPPTRVGLVLAHSSDLSQGAAVVYDTTTSTLSVHRSLSTSHADINTLATDGGPLRLLHVANPDAEDAPRREKLELRVFLDNSVLEVYANGRWACSSRIYPEESAESSSSSSPSGTDALVGLSVFAMGSGHGGDAAATQQVDVESRVWERLRPAFAHE